MGGQLAVRLGSGNGDGSWVAADIRLQGRGYSYRVGRHTSVTGTVNEAEWWRTLRCKGGTVEGSCGVSRLG